MKKILCILLSIIFITLSCLGAFGAYASTDIDEISADRFAADVSNLIIAAESSINLYDKEIINDSEFSTSRLIVKCQKKINTQNARYVANGFDDLWVLQYSNPQEAKKAYEYYSTLKDVEFVEADKEISALMGESSSDSFEDSIIALSEDKEYLSWGPKHIGIDNLNNSLKLNMTPLSDVIVAVVDTGVDPDHPFLDGRVLPTRINTSSSGIRNNSMDDNGHGTQVAGVIADCTLENIFIQPYKVLNNKGHGTLISVAAGINCAVNDGVDVINISIGFEETSDVLKAAIDNAEKNDIIVVGSAGNDGSDTLYYPSSYDYVIKVSAINNNNIIPSFSTYGNGVDFAAPGLSIKTTTLNGEYISTRGTSIAAPFISSAAATLKAIDNNMSAEEIYNDLAVDSVKIEEYNADEKYGNGVINLGQHGFSFNLKEKVETPYFSDNAKFSFSAIDIEIFCDTPDAEIYYTTDRSVPTKSNPNAKIYNGTPIHTSQTITIIAVAYRKDMHRSAIASFSAIVAPYVNENEIEITPDGTIIAYNGSASSITIPEEVNGITVKALGDNSFKESDITEIILPNTLTVIGNSAFEKCEKLKTIYSKNATTIGDYAFQDCIFLKNIFLISDLLNIGKYSFENTGSTQALISGVTFNLPLSKVTVIPEGAFSKSSIASIELDYVSNIGKNAFLNCDQLVNIKINNLSNIPDGCFKGCASLTDVEIKGLTYVSAGAFSTCENLISVSVPNARSINSNAFENCISLIEVNLPSAKTVFSNAFNNCQKLYKLVLPEMTEFEGTIYGQSKTYPLLPPNLEEFEAPKITKTVPDMFKNCPDISTIDLSSATEIAPNTFNGCHDIYVLYIQGVENLSENTFANTTIKFIDARNLITSADMPDNSGILLSNNFIESTDKAENLTVYGTPNTFVERYSNLKGYKFVPIPLIINQLPDYVTESSELIYILAIGFDLTYQWYWNTEPSTEGGTPIDGANTLAYTFTEKDTAPYYYCEIIQNDLGTITRITTNIITKDTVPADYTEYNKAVEAANALDRNIYVSLVELDKALSVDVNDRYSCEQDYVDEVTKSIYDAIENLKIKIVNNVNLYASDTDLGLFEGVRIISVIQPHDAKYEKTEWVSSNENILIVSDTGYVRCIGDGTADIKLIVTNVDGSVSEETIAFYCELTTFEKIVAFMFKFIFILAAK